MLVTLPLALKAHTPDTLFMHFPATDYPILAEELPEVSYSKDLNALGYTAADAHLCSALIEYPEFAPLTTEEHNRLRKYFATHSKEETALGEMPHVTTRSNIFRKKPLLDVSFCPIVVRNGKYERLVSCKLVVKSPVSSSRKKVESNIENRYAANSVLASGKWVKIAVSKEGMYEITAAQLQKWGFNNINRVKLYGYGGRLITERLEFTGSNSVIDDLNEVPLYRKSESVLFYGYGPLSWSYNSTTGVTTHTDNYYSTRGYYFITEGDSPAKIEEAPITETSTSYSTISYVPSASLYDGNAFAWYDGGRRLFDSYDFASGSSHTYRVDTPDYDEEADMFPPTLTVSFSASHPVNSTPLSINMNGTEVAKQNIGKYGNNESARVVTTNTKVGSHMATTNNITLITGNSNNARLDYISLSYPRRLNASSQPFSFVTGRTEPVQLEIANATAGTQVWELPHGATPLQRMPATLNGKTLLTSAIPTNTRVALVNVNASYSAPEYVGEVSNQNLHADKDIDMVIVVPSSGKLLSEANRLAEIHRNHDGLRVRVVRACDIYNEFSSGTPDASAIRRYMKMLYDRAESEDNMPRYLLLFGNGLMDNRMLTSANSRKQADDYLLCYEIDNNLNSIGELHSYCTDDYFGLLDDGEGNTILTEKIDLGIGRFCCTTPEEAKVLVDKAARYLFNEDAGDWKNNIMLMGDYGDSNTHMEDAERVGLDLSNADSRLNILKLYPDMYKSTIAATGITFPQATTRMEEILKQGVTLVNYSGHGSPNQISHGWLTSTEHLRSINNRHLPLWLLASCEIFPIDSEEENLGRMSMLKPDGGAIGFICATRSVYASYNNPLNRKVGQYLLTKTPEGERYTFGEALMKGKVDMISQSTDKTMNKLKYVLIGDPALVLSTPRYNITLDSINGEPFESSPEAPLKTLQAASAVRLSGHTEHADDGFVTIRIFDHSQTITCLNNSLDNVDNFQFNSLGNCVFTGTTTLENGKFSITATIPFDIDYADLPARISLYAVNTDKTREYAGVYSNICLNGTDEAAKNDVTPPSVFLYIGEEDFPNGGITAPSFQLDARIADDFGINVAGSGLGHDMSLIVDGDVANSIRVNDYFSYDLGTYLSGRLSYPMQDFTPGLHTLDLRVWDICNNSTLAHLDIMVQNEVAADNKFSVAITQNPVKTSTTIVASLVDNAVNEPVNFYIYDAAGNLVWNMEVYTIDADRYISVPWAAVNNAGAPLGSGVYFLSAKHGKERCRAKKIIVFRQ